MNLVGPILSHARTRPEVPALIEGDRTIDYRELAALVSRNAAHLAALGIKRGDRIGLCLKDTSDHVIALLAAARIGAVTVPLDWRAPGRENDRVVCGLPVKQVIVEPDARLSTACPVVALDATWHRAAALIDPVGPSATDWTDPFVILATSGTTGTPKFNLVSHLVCFFRIAGWFELIKLAGRHRYLSTAPLCHGAAQTRCIAHLLRGDCVILYPSLFTPAEYVEVANRERATVGFMVPSMIRQMLASARDEPLLPGMAALFSGGAPLYAEEKRQAARRLTANFSENYGTTETGFITGLCPTDLALRGDSVGQPHSLVEIEVVDDENRVLPRGDCGRLRCRGPILASPMPGFVGAPVQASFCDSWCYPGEMAWIDELGYVFLRGRVSDVIIRGGANIFPAEIENVLQAHPDVAAAAVIGQRADDNEEQIVAFVVTRRRLGAGELFAHCRMRLTPYKVPREIRVVAQLPKGAAGKIDKAVLAKWAAGESADPVVGP